MHGPRVSWPKSNRVEASTDEAEFMVNERLIRPPINIDDSPRHALIERLTNPHTETNFDGAMVLWRKLATQVILIIGEMGFNALYERSLSLTLPRFPWIASHLPPPQTWHSVEQFQIGFGVQTHPQATEANRTLLIIFTDILASLIGEQLTCNILRSAWSDDASNPANKELNNE